jgi:heme oxygenase
MHSSNQRPALEYPAIDSANNSAIAQCSRRTPLTLRQSLRAATAEVHALLHRHTGFASIQNGTIDLVDYRLLLVRLYGFHAPFEAVMGISSERSAWLQDDLAAVSIGGHTAPANIPRCTALTAFATPAGRLGALYVVEGSTLGGRHLARTLDPLIGSTGTAGRRFFLGRGADTTTAWNAFLARMTSSTRTPAARSEAVAAAVTTFSIFQDWMGGWRDFAV